MPRVIFFKDVTYKTRKYVLYIYSVSLNVFNIIVFMGSKFFSKNQYIRLIQWLSRC